jgi:kumamolisin
VILPRGNNGAYEAQIGWDACTGLGTPIFPQLLAALQSPTGRGHGPALKHQDAQNA